MEMRKISRRRRRSVNGTEFGQNLVAILVTRTAICRVENAFSTRLKLIWPRSSLKTTKMSKNAILAESSRCQWADWWVRTFSKRGVKPKLIETDVLCDKFLLSWVKMADRRGRCWQENFYECNFGFKFGFAKIVQFLFVYFVCFLILTEEY